METIKLNVYKFNELSNEAKNQAINEVFKNGLQMFESYNDDIINSINKLCDLLNIKTGRTYDFIIKEADFINLEGIRLYKYLVNNFYNDLFKPRFLTVLDKHIKTNAFIVRNATNYKGEQRAFLYSKIFVTNDSVLTGVSSDLEILQPIYEFLKDPKKNYTGFDLLKDIERAISQSFRQVEEYENNEDLRAEFLQENDFNFLLNGKIFEI